MTQHRITIEMEVQNHNNTIISGSAHFDSAFTLDGMECKDKKALNDGHHTVYGVKYPVQVKVKQNFYVLNVMEKIEGFSYVELAVRGAKIVIRNLPVEW